VACVQWPEALSAGEASWGVVKAAVLAARPDILVTNELPFGPWIAGGAAFSEEAAWRIFRAHQTGLEALIELHLPAVISSRAVWSGRRLANQAFVLERGVVRVLHQKQSFPSEPGWFESAWYARNRSGFAVAEILGVRVGVLLCTEVMFNERARAYGREGAELIVIPRASGPDLEPWKTAGAMTALVSGAYVASSNRAGRSGSGVSFGGGGFAYAPGGRLLALTTPTEPVQTFELDLATVEAAKRSYPCYMPEIA
jgi:N-carbamoylputrescine amidase